MTEIKRIRVGQLLTNCYVVSKNGVAFVIDVGANAKKVKDYCDNQNLKVEGILLTHGHYDHVGAVKEFHEMTGAKIYVSTLDGTLANDRRNMAIEMGCVMDPFTPEVLLEDGDHITKGDMDITVIATPGHTSGGVCFVLEDQIFSGDTLFQTSYGRTDLPTGNYNELKKSIHKLFALDGNFNVHPGHGFSTTLDDERKHNMINFDD
jgi:glyoxylase-like metal-dependent hydrolase (beta-lactamase superfamily II)